MTAPATLQFDRSAAMTVNLIVALMMFGASLTLTLEDFRRVLRTPRALAAGFATQYLVFPGLVTLLGLVLPVPPPLVLAATFIAALPGGSFSNVLTWIARGNVALSVGLTAFASLTAPVLTPASLALWGAVNPKTREALRAITLPPEGVLTIVVMVLVVPITAGMLLGARFPAQARRAEGPLRKVALALFFGFIAIFFAANRGLFVERFHEFFWVTVVTNAIALGSGLLVGRVAGLPAGDQHALAIEVGIKNVGLGLVVLLTFYPQGETLLIINAFWGVWHLLTGVALAQWWGRQAVRAGRAVGDASAGSGASLA